MEPARVGDRVGDQQLTVVHPDGSTEPVGLRALAGDGPLLLAFLSYGHGPDCPAAWCPARDLAWFAASADVRVLAVARSVRRARPNAAGPLELGVPLATDAEGALAAAFGLDGDVLEAAGSAVPAAFLVGPETAVRERWLAGTDRPRAGATVRAIHDDLARRFGPRGRSPAPDASPRA